MRTRNVVAIGALLMVGGCDPTGPSVGPPAEIVLSPLATSVGVSETIPSISATVHDLEGRSVPGAVVSWTVTHGSVSPASSSTDAEGTATVSWTVGDAMGTQSISARVGDVEASATTFVMAEPAEVELAAGESIAFLSGDLASAQLTAAGTYILSVFNTSALPQSQTAFRLRGAGPASTMDPAVLAPVQHHAMPIRPDLPPDPEAEAHLWLLEANLRIARELAGRSRTTATPETMMSRALAPASITLGSTRGFRIPDLDGSLCTDPHEITARAVYTGSIAVIWEDEASPLAGQMGSRWEQVGREYEEVMHPIIREYFGDPLAYDAWLANPGRVHMVFSEVVNDFERGVAGFIFPGDFFPVSECASSDETAVFYGRVPTTSGSGYSGYTVDTWAWGMRSTIIHEVKHITSYATKLRMWAENGKVGSPNYETSWLEESTARLSEEFYARHLMGYGQGDNVTYQESIWCERRVGGDDPCDPIPAMVYKHFGAVYSYYRGVEGLSPFGAAVSDDWTFYGSGWLFVRWAMDHSGMSEQDFSRALIDEPSRSGVGNMTARAGRTFPAMLADFTLAMTMDDHPAGAALRPELSFPGWHTRDIMAGLHEDHRETSLAETYSVAWPLQARSLAGGDFDVSLDGIRGGTAAFFQLTVQPGSRQLLHVLSSGGGEPAANLGLAIVRVN